MNDEFIESKETLVEAVTKVNWWEWIPIIGPYLYFVRINFKKNNYVKDVRKSVTTYSKILQIIGAIISLPFIIWTIYLTATEGWGFKLQIIPLLIIFALEFSTPYHWKYLFLKGLSKIN